MSSEEPDFNSMTSEQFADVLMDWPALIEHDLLYEIEEDCQNPSHGINRRVLLATLTMDSEKLFEACEESPDTYFDGF